MAHCKKKKDHKNIYPQLINMTLQEGMVIKGIIIKLSIKEGKQH
jgi:hypothetical protein